MVRPSHRRAVAQLSVQTKRTSVRHAGTPFASSETCDRYHGTRVDENSAVADGFVRLTTTHRTWGFGLCCLYLRHITHVPWNHQRVSGVYRALARNRRITPKCQ